MLLLWTAPPTKRRRRRRRIHKWNTLEVEIFMPCIHGLGGQTLRLLGFHYERNMGNGKYNKLTCNVNDIAIYSHARPADTKTTESEIGSTLV